MVFISTITLFSFTEKTKFSTSLTYKLVEYLTIAAIIGACGAELVTLVAELAEQLISVAKNLQKNSKRQKIDRIEEIAKCQNEDQNVLDNFEKIDQMKNEHQKGNNFRLESRAPNFSIQKKDRVLRGRVLTKNHHETYQRDVRGPTNNRVSIFGNISSQNQRKIDISVKPRAARNRTRWRESDQKGRE